MASGRIQRWALTLSSYEYELKYRQGKDQPNCDALSRLPLSDCPETVPISVDILLLTEQLSSSPVTAKEIKVKMQKDQVLSKVLRFVLHGWPHAKVEEELKPYFMRRNELSHFDGCATEQPWSHIHIDYAGPFLNKMLLVIIDAHSKWMEVIPVSNATTSVTVEKLLGMLMVHGLPHSIVSDNRSVFTSSELFF